MTLASFLVVGYYTNHFFSTDISGPLLLLIWLAAILLLYFAITLLWRKLDAISSRRARKQKSITAKILKKAHNRPALFWICVQLCLLLCWLPIWLACWPGFYCYDTGTLASFHSGVYVTEHPLLYTLVASRIVFGLGSLLGDINIGVSILSCFDALILSSVLVQSLRLIFNDGRVGLSIAGFVFFALNPAISMFAFCTVKDVSSSALLASLFLLLVHVLKHPDRVSRLHMQISLALLIFLLASLRNNTALAIVISFPIIMVACKGHRRDIATAFIAGFTLFALWNWPIANAITAGHEKTPSHSLLLINSVPEQQLAYTWNNPTLSDRERANYRKVISPGSEASLESFRYDDADVAREAFAEVLIYDVNLSAFYQLYVQEGLGHPADYAKAALLLTYESWYPFSTPRGYNGGWNTNYGYDTSTTSLFACNVEEPARLSSKVPALYELLYKISRFDILQKNPLTAWLVSIPFCLWLLVLTFSRAFIKRRWDILAPCFLMLAVVLSFWLGPMVLLRYYLSLFILVPTLVNCLVSAGPEKAITCSETTSPRHTRDRNEKRDGRQRSHPPSNKGSGVNSKNVSEG